MKADLIGFGITVSTIMGVTASSMAAITNSQRRFMTHLEAEYRARSCARQLARAQNISEWSNHLRAEPWQIDQPRGATCTASPTGIEFVPWQKNPRGIQRPGQWDIRAQRAPTQGGRNHAHENERGSVDLTLILAAALLTGTWAACSSHIGRVNALWGQLDSSDGNDELCLGSICIPPRNDNESTPQNRAVCVLQDEEAAACHRN